MVNMIWLYAAMLHTFVGPGVLLAAVVALAVMLIVCWRISLIRWILVIVIILLCGPRLFIDAGTIVNSKVNSFSYRYRLALEVETPQGSKTASSVIQVAVTPKFVHWNPSASPIIVRVEGEAIFLDLGQGKNVIATLGFGPTGANTDRLSRLPSEVLGGDNGQSYKRARTWEGRAELHGGLIPTLVTFGDPADPRTLRVVQPDEFVAVLGPGYRFKGAWIEMTKDDVTRGRIQEKLPWVGSYDAERIAERQMRLADQGKGSSGTPGMKFRRGQ